MIQKRFYNKIILKFLPWLMIFTNINIIILTQEHNGNSSLNFISTYEGNDVWRWKYFELKPSEKNDNDVVTIMLSTSLSCSIF